MDIAEKFRRGLEIEAYKLTEFLLAHNEHVNIADWSHCGIPSCAWIPSAIRLQRFDFVRNLNDRFDVYNLTTIEPLLNGPWDAWITEIRYWEPDDQISERLRIVVDTTTFDYYGFPTKSLLSLIDQWQQRTGKNAVGYQDLFERVNQTPERAEPKTNFEEMCQSNLSTWSGEEFDPMLAKCARLNKIAPVTYRRDWLSPHNFLLRFIRDEKKIRAVFPNFRYDLADDAPKIDTYDKCIFSKNIDVSYLWDRDDDLLITRRLRDEIQTVYFKLVIRRYCRCTLRNSDGVFQAGYSPLLPLYITDHTANY